MTVKQFIRRMEHCAWGLGSTGRKTGWMVDMSNSMNDDIKKVRAHLEKEKSRKKARRKAKRKANRKITS